MLFQRIVFIKVKEYKYSLNDYYIEVVMNISNTYEIMKPNIETDKNNYILYSYLKSKEKTIKNKTFLTLICSYICNDDEKEKCGYITIYKRLNTYVIDNIFCSKQQKLSIINDIYEFKKTMNILRRFVIKLKWRYAKKYDIDTDLCLNSLSNLRENQTIKLLQNKTIYTFSVFDMKKLFTMGLMNNDHLYFEPILPKNPYTNVVFSINELYIISKYLKKNTHLPAYIHSFIENNFDLDKFTIYNQPLLIENTVKSYIGTLSKIVKYSKIIDLFKKYTRYTLTKTANIDNVVNKLNHAVFLYYKIELLSLNCIDDGFNYKYVQIICSLLSVYIMMNKNDVRLNIIKIKRKNRNNISEQLEEGQIQDSYNVSGNSDSESITSIDTSTDETSV